jgi:hypothetical protein
VVLVPVEARASRPAAHLAGLLGGGLGSIGKGGSPVSELSIEFTAFDLDSSVG